MKQSNYLNFKNHHIYVGFHSFPISRLGTSLDWERLPIGNVSRYRNSPNSYVRLTIWHL